MGLSDEQFWNLTPPQFAALSERHEELTEIADHRAGIICSTIANTRIGPDDEPFTARMFMPSYGRVEDEREPKNKPKSREMTGEQIKNFLMAHFPPGAKPKGAGGG
jgi:hypothetical protein